MLAPPDDIIFLVMFSLIQCVMFPVPVVLHQALQVELTLMGGSADEADADGVEWCSGVCSSNSGGTWQTKLSRSGS